MSHPAFQDAGNNPGIEIWAIDKFEPVPIDSNKYGKFYNGDSYIVLKTTGDNTSSLSYDAHFWLGSKATQDKMGSAAILTVTLDDMLGGKAVHHREVQGHESSRFLGYFQPGPRRHLTDSIPMTLISFTIAALTRKRVVSQRFVATEEHRVETEQILIENQTTLVHIL